MRRRLRDVSTFDIRLAGRNLRRLRQVLEELFPTLFSGGGHF